jgi:anti-sigma regulatory factor (Ser/Thr protein kinase)
VTGDSAPDGAPNGRDAGRSLSWEGTFPPDASAVRRCRGEVERVLLEGGVAPEARVDALVVLGEIVGNAARHARTEFTVAVSLRAGILRLEVFDADTRPPALLGLDAESTSGRGLHIVAGVARDWGWQTAVGADGVSGKLVWAELALEPPEAPGGR